MAARPVLLTATSLPCIGRLRAPTELEAALVALCEEGPAEEPIAISRVSMVRLRRHETDAESLEQIDRAFDELFDFFARAS